MVLASVVLATTVLAATGIAVSRAAAKCLYTNPDAPLTLPAPSPPESAKAPPPRPAIPPTVTTDLNPGFAYHPPGALLPQDKGRGRVGDRRVYAPKMIFPVKLQPGGERAPGKHAFMNSQIWNFGGWGYGKVKGPGGSECTASNFDPLLQRDNFCEVRGWDMPMCPSGQGHQGQDIRPPSCADNTWEVVAVVDGIITSVTRSTQVELKGDDGTLYEYLHMHPSSIKVQRGQRVKQGQSLGKISNYMGGKPATTRHLHFNIEQTITIDGDTDRVYVPPYTSLIAAYRRSKGLDPGIDSAGNLIVDPLLEIGAAAAKEPPPITSWAIPNATERNGRAIAQIDVSKYFRPRLATTKLRYTATGLPTGLRLDGESGIVRGQLEPTASQGGTDGGTTGAYTVTVTAEDDKGAKAQQSFVITAVYAPLEIGTATRGKFFKDGSRVLIDAGAAVVNPNAAVVKYAATGLPTGLRITAATGRISGRLAANASKGGENGVYTITVTADDGKSKVEQKFTLTAEPQKEPAPVTPLPPPIIVAALPSLQIYVGEAVAIDAGAAFKPGYGYQAMRFAASSLPIGLTIDPDTGRISGTLAPEALEGGDGGSYTVRVIADNGEGGTAAQSFVLTAQSRAPVVVIPTINEIFREGQTVDVPVAAAFSAPETSVLTYTVTGLPRGVVFDKAAGRVTGTIAAGAAAARPNGVYSITASADDGKGGRASQTFAVTVEAAPEPPKVIGPIPATGHPVELPIEPIRAGAAFEPWVAANPLTFTAVGLPANLAIDAATGEITGAIARAALDGQATRRFDVTVTATDAKTKLTASQSTLIVAEGPPAPPAPAPEPPKPAPPAPAPEPPKPAPPAPAPEPPKPAPPAPAPEPPKPAPPAPAPEPPKPAPPAPAPEPPKPAPPAPAPEPPKPAPPAPAPEPPKPAPPPVAPSPPPPEKPTAQQGWGSWAYGYAKGAWDWVGGLFGGGGGK
jgi:murein DD-endopeptidase MepM/ murein hydrolase activator NlpD